MAINQCLIVIFTIFMVVNLKKSIKQIHVQCGDVQQHHIRHFNHHFQHLLQQHRLRQRHKIDPAAHDFYADDRSHSNPTIVDLRRNDRLTIISKSSRELVDNAEADDTSSNPAVVHHTKLPSPSSSSSPFQVLSDVDDNASPKMLLDSTNTAKINCPKCSGTTNVRISEEELTELRIEFVKNQILQKLRLKERPKITINGLPRPIYEGTTIHGDVQTQSKDLDDYYARTSQKFIFLEQERAQCDRVNQNPSICFTFNIEGDIDTIDVSTAELWIYKNNNKEDIDVKQTFIVSELDKNSNNHSDDDLPIVKPIAIQSIGTEAGWIKIDIAWATKQWFNNRQLSHIIQITCQACEMVTLNDSLLSTENDLRPFILIDTLNRRKMRRQKRNVNCSVGVTECCREKLYISFAEIGWDDWILQPSGYDAYFCRGSCSTAASITMSNSHYSSVLRKVIYQRKTSGGKALELIPCCTAKKFSSLQLLYLDSNNTGTVKTLPNMVVESCGCM